MTRCGGLIHQTRNLLPGRQTPFRRKLVYCVRKNLRQDHRDLILWDPGALRESIDDVWTQRIRDLVSWDNLVLPCAYPGIDRVAQTILLKLLSKPPSPPRRSLGEASGSEVAPVFGLSEAGASFAPPLM